MYCLYMFCRGILVIEPRKEPLKILELGIQITVAPDDRTPSTGCPDSTETGFQFCPSNGNVSSRVYLRHSSKHQTRSRKYRKEKIKPKRDYIIVRSFVSFN